VTGRIVGDLLTFDLSEGASAVTPTGWAPAPESPEIATAAEKTNDASSPT
jgi:hypothetical protein